jgi:uncharacterized membrane protein YraQ (UPF0718 family)
VGGITVFQGILTTLIQVIITLVVPIIAAWISRYIKEKIKNEGAQRCLLEVNDAVKTAVLCVSQTYTDGLKKQKAFDVSNQYTAFKMAADKTKEILSDETIQYLSTTYGDIATYLTPKIEAEVKMQK